MTHARTIALALLVVVSFGGCASEFAGSYADQRQAPAASETRSPAAVAADSAVAGFAEAGSSTPATAELNPEPTQPVVASIQRQVIYTGALTVLSPDPAGATEAVRQIVDSAGGYLSSVQGQRVVLRVPADRFNSVMREVAALGLVIDRQITANDVTAELVDLNIRIDNLQALRERMKALLEKADKVEDALNIEKELARLTGEIELMKGRLRLLTDQVSLSTITVLFNTPRHTASGLASKVRPFPWVNTVGGEAFGAAALPQAQSKLGRGAELDLPDGFVRFYQKDYEVYALGRGQVVMKVSRVSNYDEASAGFWVDQVRERLTEELGVPMDEPRRVTIRDDEVGYTMTGSRPAGQEQLGYFVGLAASDDHVFVIEAWGPADEVEAKQDELIRSLQTLRINRGWW